MVSQSEAPIPSEAPKIEKKSGIYKRAGYRVDLIAVPEYLMSKVEAAITRARLAIVKVLVDEKGQLMFPFTNIDVEDDEVLIHEEDLHTFLSMVSDSLENTGIAFEIDENAGSIRAKKEVDINSEGPRDAGGFHRTSDWWT